MPHCEASLYDALLAANWGSPAQLRRVCVLGDSFCRYALQAEDSRSGPAARAAVHVLAAERFACEERVSVMRDPDQDDWFARNFFEVDDDVDLPTSIALLQDRHKFQSSVHCGNCDLVVVYVVCCLIGCNVDQDSKFRILCCIPSY
jgi:hypothetical protein